MLNQFLKYYDKVQINFQFTVYTLIRKMWPKNKGKMIFS